MSKFFHRVAEQLIDALVSAVLSSAISFLSFKPTNPNYLKVIVASILLMTMLFMIVFAFLRKAVKYKFRIRSLDIFVEYTKKNVKITCSYTLSTYSMFQKSVFTDHVLSENDQPIFRVRPPKFEHDKIEIARNEYDYSVRFPKPLSFWDAPIKFRTIRVIPINSMPKSCYAYKVIYPIDNLTIDVRIPESMCSETAEVTSYHVYEKEDLATHEDISYCCGYRYTPKNLHVDYKYAVKWKWSEDAKELYEQKR